MLTLFRRFLVVAALAFWQGGFTFYAGVVVHVAQAQIGHTRQGFITRQVTDYLNLAGGVALLLLAWDAAVSREPSHKRRRFRWAAWLGMSVALLLMLWLHIRMEALLDVEQRVVLDPPVFRRYHAGYLWLSTVQWGCALGYTVLALQTWRTEDGSAKNVPSSTSSASPSHRSRQPTGQAQL